MLFRSWGTGHAIYCVRDIVKDNFAVINADDFYGRDTFMRLAEHLKNAKTENGVAHIFVDQELKDKFHLSNEAASACVGYMDSIKNVIAWIAFIDSGDGSIRVRFRSRFVTISELAERYNGGGHACACGATLHSKAEVKALLADADKLLKEYKERNEGWL